MQYKLLRYSDAINPRRFMEGQEHDFEGKIGKIVFTTPVKDPVTKAKFWQTKVVFKFDDGTERTEMFKDAAQLNAIKIFYTTLDGPLPTDNLKDFNVAQFYERIDANKRAELKADIVHLQPQGRKLTATYRKMIENTFFFHLGTVIQKLKCVFHLETKKGLRSL